MNALSNSVQLIGFLGKELEFTQLEKDKKLVRLSLATNEDRKHADGTKSTDTQWHRLIAWDKKAEFISNYFKKGQKIAIQGKLTYRSYDDKEGQTKYMTEIVVSEVMRVGKED